MSGLMPAYVYNTDPNAETRVQAAKIAPVGTVSCRDAGGCNGSGIYYGAGAIVNGHFVGFSGKCYRCGGKGYQTDSDKKRNRYYDDNIRRFSL